MRQLILALTILTPVLSWGVTDYTVLNAYDRARTGISLETTQEGRLAKLEEFKALVSLKLNTIELPEDIMNTPDNDPRIENFRSLNELEGYLDLVTVKHIHQQSCSKAQVKVIASTSGKQDGYVSSEAKMALELLKAMCTR